MDKYNVFLSHTSDDKPAVEQVAERLMDEGIMPWLDSWNLIPGQPWQEDIEEALDSCPVCAVFLGPSGLGTWHNEQMRVAIERRVADRSRRYRLIPVLLPGAESADRRTLPSFLRRYTWVDFRQGLDDADTFSRLVAGIRGKAPGPPRRRGKKRVTPAPSVLPPPAAAPSVAQPSVRSYRHFDLPLERGERNQLLVEGPQISPTEPQSKMAQIRKMLDLAFDDSRLSAFCLDYYSEVYDKFSEGMRKDYKITLLLDHCRRRPTSLERLLDLVRKED